MSDHKALAMRQQGLAKGLNQSLKAGSLDDLVKRKGTVFEGKIVFLLDCSGSMGSRMYTGQSRMHGLRAAVKEVQAAQGPSLKIPMIQFGAGWDEVGECLEIPDAEGGTPLHKAIDLAKQKEYGRAICISDGMPDSQEKALESAKRFGGRIDVIFTGNAGEPGEAFLKHLAEMTGGEQFTGDLADIKQISGTITLLLGNGSDEDDDEKGAIQL